METKTIKESLYYQFIPALSLISVLSPVLGSGGQFRHEKTKEKYATFIHEQVKTWIRPQFKKQAPAIADAILKEAKRNQLSPLLLLSVIFHESRLNPKALGGVGEIGLMQLRPETAVWLAKKFSIRSFKAQDLWNPEINVKMGALYLSYLKKKFQEKGHLFLSAYNMGLRNVHKNLKRNVVPVAYASKVIEFYSRFQKQYGYQQIDTLNLSTAFLAQAQ